MKHLLLLLSFLCFSFVLCAQAGKEEKQYHLTESYISIHQQGEQALLLNKYGEALRHFKKVLKKYPGFSPSLRSAGACYELMGDLEEAVRYYEMAIEFNPTFSRAIYFETGNIHYKRGRYDLALQCFHTFDSLMQHNPKQFAYNGMEEHSVEQGYLAKLEASRRACQIAQDSILFWNISGVENLGPVINTSADEYFPFVTNDGRAMFYTSRKDQTTDENLFYSVRNENGWNNGEKVSGFNTRKNEGMTSLVRDGRHVYFTACERASVLGTCDIWQAQVTGLRVHDAEPLTGWVNSEFWESQACISCDGSWLYFASNREGGYGGTDLWKSERQSDGKWSEPENLGKNINTPGDEEAPFLTNDGKTLYFSSNGHVGLGEQDLFMSKLEGEKFWSLPVNLGMPVNSPNRELGFFLSANGKTGYFASDRAGGAGGMDIYRFELPAVLHSEPVTYVEGLVLDSITQLPVVATVVIEGQEPQQTDEEGRFFLCEKAGTELNIKVVHKDYHTYRHTFQIEEWDNSTNFRLDIQLDPLFKLPKYTGPLEPDPIMVSLKSPMTKKLKHSILFDFDQASLKPAVKKELDLFLKEVFNDHRVKKVEVIGYADQLGDDNYNFSLSEKRAREVGHYLEQQGIEIEKVYVEGKGETSNDLPDWQNRRVEVVVFLSR